MCVSHLLSPMATHPLANYLKTYRKQSGLLQREVAFLLGWKSGEQFARYEKRHRLPTLRVALALEEVFKVPAKELFAGVNDSVAREIKGRIGKLAADLQEKNGGKDAGPTAKKLSWLAAHHGSPASPIPGK